MAPPNGGYHSIDEYIDTFPDEIQALLETVRATIHAAAPEATEAITYQMPAFVQEGTLVNFAAWKNHIALYPTPSGIADAYKDELAKYAGSKGTVRFPHSQPLPLDLIRAIVQARLTENLNNAAAKADKTKA